MADTNVTNLWEQRKAKWRLLVALRDADLEFGAYSKANNTHSELTFKATSQFGNIIRAQADAEMGPALSAALAQTMEADTAWYNDYVHPADLAAIELVLTPASDLDGLLLKIEISKAHELDNAADMPACPMEAILADVARLNLLEAA